MLKGTGLISVSNDVIVISALTHSSFMIKWCICIGNNPQYKLQVNCLDQAGTVWVLLSRHITMKVELAKKCFSLNPGRGKGVIN